MVPWPPPGASNLEVEVGAGAARHEGLLERLGRRAEHAVVEGAEDDFLDPIMHTLMQDPASLRFAESLDPRVVEAALLADGRELKWFTELREYLKCLNTIGA